MNCVKLYILLLGVVIAVEILVSIRLTLACTQLYVLFKSNEGIGSLIHSQMV